MDREMRIRKYMQMYANQRNSAACCWLWEGGRESLAPPWSQPRCEPSDGLRSCSLLLPPKHFPLGAPPPQEVWQCEKAESPSGEGKGQGPTLG